MITNQKYVKPIPKYIAEKIKKLDLKECPDQKGACRFYAYLATMAKELVKVTVAVKNFRRKWYIKQVAIHGVKSDKCIVRDIEYVYYSGMGYRVGWCVDGIQKHKKWFEDGNWYSVDSKYYNPYATVINLDYVEKFPEYKYSAYRLFDGRCIIEYLKLYTQYPQTEYLLKLGLPYLADSTTVLKQIAKDKKFCKWLIANKEAITTKHLYIGTIMTAYKTGQPFEIVQRIAEFKKRKNDFPEIRELFKDKDLERLFSYIMKQNIDPASYTDYLKACTYLGLDMRLNKNRFPHDFSRWHDIRIDEYHSAKALADEQQRKELYERFAKVANKYLPLQESKKSGFVIVIANRPAELMREGEILHHCVGRMGYDQKMVREESLIFFVRDKDNPDVPLATVEYSLTAKRVLQCYGDKSLPPNSTITEYVNKVWLPYANRKVKKLAA